MQNLIKILFPYSFKKSSLLVWAVLTALYLSFAFFSFFTSGGPPESVLPTFLGLFVPYGIWNFTLSLVSHAALFLLILFPFILLSLDAFLARYNVTSPRHYLFALLFLFVWTLLVDFIIYDNQYQSLYLFLEALGFDFDAVSI